MKDEDKVKRDRGGTAAHTEPPQPTRRQRDGIQASRLQPVLPHSSFHHREVLASNAPHSDAVESTRRNVIESPRERSY